MLNLEKIGSKITELRKQHKMKQNELADTLFVTHQAVSKWENGKSIPSIEILYDLTKIFKVSIDYLLDDSEISEHDYASQFKNYPREAIISKFLKLENLDNEVEKIFYLLNKDERRMILEQIISKKVNISLEIIWPFLSAKERTYILGVVLSKKFKFDLSKIYHQLTSEEQHLVISHYQSGTYDFTLPHRKGVIL